MRTLVALTVIYAAGARFAPGDAFPFDGSEDEAQELLDAGNVRDPEEHELPLADLPPSHERRLAAIAAIVDALAADDWTQGGTPKVQALAGPLAFVPTAEEAARFKRKAA